MLHTIPNSQYNNTYNSRCDPFIHFIKSTLWSNTQKENTFEHLNTPRSTQMVYLKCMNTLPSMHPLFTQKACGSQLMGIWKYACNSIIYIASKSFLLGILYISSQVERFLSKERLLCRPYNGLKRVLQLQEKEVANHIGLSTLVNLFLTSKQALAYKRTI